ncbi:hypothetical protein A4H97_18005 [Niastella yeongjuensis]|uniref:L,D-TPase catalytic domain-containing protein n=1 Tax=Niastella yeongjuensis TaxID=354355 RepID=A0A1V9DXU2_9BACT|nr:L,D-transpeptidase [Niastella yeongjuensis]OQP38619.1 hypothetical protein A4H97_18005 [Niastella yeongjuensis]SEO39304.1 L,D-transpeptidase catalytic domain [Niastella yeongjuensis]
MSKIVVQLNADRTLGGQLKVVNSSGAQQGFGFAALGKAANNDAAAHGNPGANQLFLFGDTPTGTYSIKTITDGPYKGNTKSYGPNGVFKLDPVSGNAALAETNGRIGILIHGGDLGPNAQLRRTNGCLRMRNDEFLALKTLVQNLSISDPVDVLEVFENGTSADPSFNNDTCGDGDPPPDF